jgi:hypothetical protein
MGSSLGFGSIQCNLSPISDSLSLRLHLYGLTLLHKITRWLIKQKARGLAVFPCGQHSYSTACKHLVSGTISLSSPEYFSPFPHGTCSLSVVNKYLALGGGPPGFTQDSTYPVLLGCLITGACYLFAYRTITVYG